MAEEGTLGISRAAREKDEEPSKEELQRRMEEARESITQTVTEIKETVTNQYYSVKETVSDALDWRHHFRKNPIAFTIGALSVGALVGYTVTGALKGNGRGREDYPSPEESDVYARTGATPPRYEVDAERHSAFHGHSYAAQPITDTTHETSDYKRSPAGATEDEEASDNSQGQDSSLSNNAPRPLAQEEQAGPQKPGLLERFKGTTAYDRLQTEVASLGDRFIEELSSTAHNVVLPALFNRIKDLFGVDLSGKTKQGQEQQQAQGSRRAQTETKTQAASAQAAGVAASRSSSAYATSENRGYGAQDSEGAANRKENDSILDLDR